MLSQHHLAMINQRLKQSTGIHSKPFGGLSVILIGDPAQLLPVGGAPLYAKPTKLLQTAGFEVYQHFKVAITLNQCHRQQNLDNDTDQSTFINVLGRLRDGVFDEKSIEDWKFLLKNQVSPSKLEQFTDAIRLFTTNQACSDYNNMKLKELNQSIYKLIAINTPSAAKIYNSDNFNGLQNILNVCINAKITLTMNLWTNKGLVNGANGVIRDIIFAENAIEGSLPEAIFIEFDNYIAQNFSAQMTIVIIGFLLTQEMCIVNIIKLADNSILFDWHMR